MSQVPVNRDQFHNIIQASYGDKAFRGEYDGSSNLIYAGFALPGSDPEDRVWQIKLLTYAGTDLTEITWPLLNGKASPSFSFAWDDRATYTYQ